MILEMPVARPQRPSSAQGGFFSNYEMSVHSFESGKKMIFNFRCKFRGILKKVIISFIFSSASYVASFIKLSVDEIVEFYKQQSHVASWIKLNE